MTTASRASLRALLVIGLLCLVSGAAALQRRAQWSRSDSFQDQETQDTFVSLSELEARIKDIPIDGCNECRYLDDDPLEKVRGEAESDDDRKRFQKDTEAKALKVLRMLEEMNPDGPDAKEAKVEKSIMEQKRLFELASKVRDKALQVLMRNGIEVRLPSEHKTYIDASGRHWGDAEMKDDVSYLKTEFHKWMEEQMKKEQAERNRDNVKQFHNPLAIPAKTVEKLENRGPKQCPCSCPVTQCPCECEAKIKTADFNQKVEPDTFEELANAPKKRCGPTGRLC